MAAHAIRVTRARAATAALGEDPALETLRRALVEDVEHSASMLAEHLAMHYGRRRVDRIVAALGEPGPQQRALAIELLEVLAGRETGERIVALLDPHTPGDDLTAALDGTGRSRVVGGRVGHRPGRRPRGPLGRLVVEGVRDPGGPGRAR